MPGRYAAVNTETYNLSAMCGACITVTGTAGSSTCKVADLNPGTEFAEGDLDLSEDGFALIGNISNGVAPIIWHVLPCNRETKSYSYPGYSPKHRYSDYKNESEIAESNEVSEELMLL